VTREDLLVAVAAGADGRFRLDPIRLMKAAFIVSQRGPGSVRGLFSFEPYAYGPFDVAVYEARDVLVAKGLLTADKEGRYEKYSLSEEGLRQAEELRDAMGPDTFEWLNRVGAYVTSRSFSQLLREVYREFPEYARNSVFTG
jgi:hypothetical protein